MRIITNTSKVLLLVLAAGLISPELDAQPVNISERRVTLVEADSTRSPNGTMVFRRAGREDPDVIALAPGANTGDLGRALRVLDALHAQFGDSITRDIAASARSEQAPMTATASSRDRARLHASFLSQLRRAPKRAVAGFGSVRALDIYVPRKTSGKAGGSPKVRL